MNFKPGSLAWLLAFDLRLMLRSMAGRMRVGYVRMLVTFAIFWLVLMHGLAWVVVVGIRAASAHITPMQTNLSLSIVLLLLFLTMAGISMISVINLIFTRGDLDTLCTSPVPIRNIFMARSLIIALQALALPAFLLFPVANVAALYGQFRWLVLYPSLTAESVLAAALAIVFTLALVRAIGPRRARTAALMAGSLLGVSIFLIFELPSMLGKTVEAHGKQILLHWLHTAKLAAPDSLLWYPARAMQGDLWPLLAFIAVAVIVFFAVTFNLRRGFLLATQRAAGLAATTGHRKSAKATFNPQFWRVMFFKEWRLVYRNPQLLMQIFKTVVFLIPAAFILFRDSGQLGGNYVAAVAAALVVIAAMLANTLVWISVCAEDAPEFLATVPRSSGVLRITKMQVMLVPLWTIMLFVVIAVGVASVVVAFWLAVAVLGATLSIGLYNLWMPVPGARTEMRKAMRTSGSMRFERMLPMLAIQFGWAGVAFCMPTGHWILGVIALLVALIAPVFVWWRSRGAEPVLSY